jgi:hypothetical protein
MYFDKQRYDLLNGKDAYLLNTFGEDFTPVTKDVEKIIKAAYSEDVTIMHPATYPLSIKDACRKLGKTPYHISPGCYSVIYDNEFYSIVHCFVEDGVKTVHAIYCVGNCVLSYSMFDGEQKKLFAFPYGSMEAPAYLILLLLYTDIPKVILKSKPLKLSGHLYSKNFTEPITIAYYESI